MNGPILEDPFVDLRVSQLVFVVGKIHHRQLIFRVPAQTKGKFKEAVLQGNLESGTIRAKPYKVPVRNAFNF